jgi:hypothetical protein
MVTQKPRRLTVKKAARKGRPGQPKSIFRRIAELGDAIPPEELDRHPPDFTANFHHYMHGHPKEGSS